MSGIEFHQTIMGRTFFDSTMPRIAAALERLAGAAEELVAVAREASEGDPLVALDPDGTVRVRDDAATWCPESVRPGLEFACAALADLAEAADLIDAPTGPAGGGGGEPHVE